MKNLFPPFITLLLFSIVYGSNAQAKHWQQAVKYKMDVHMDVQRNQYQGTQELQYTNNSPDTLDQVFFHLYFNAFQPNSMMDVRSRTIVDPDKRVGERISRLKPHEIGYLKINNLTLNGQEVAYEQVGTVLEVTLKQPILPNSTVVFHSDFEGQVPLQIRRSGRDNKEGVRYSMSQWYPKMANYDEQGWHAPPYVGREFYGVWGDFDVKITIDKSYVLGGTGYLQNPNQIGHGYQDKGVKVEKPKGNELTWHFHAPKVHDFMWAADPDYTHDKILLENGITIHHLYIKNAETQTNWEKLKEYTPKALQYLSERFGEYPYKQYAVIQGGDGGMEYPMSTLITGHRPLNSLVGVMVHELAHSWFQGVLANNESLYPWMDEGFTTFASNLTMDEIFKEGEPAEFPHQATYTSYIRLAKSGIEEPLSTHADHYHTNTAYGAAAYSKGAIFLSQLGYIIGEKTRDQGMLRYWNSWQFRHPSPNDIIRIMEKESGMELDWYKEYWVYTTKSIDYGILSVVASDESTKITLERIGLMPMPIDLVITYKDGSQEMVYLPLVMQRGEKPLEPEMPSRVITESWPWTNPTKEITLTQNKRSIKSIEIDPSGRMADINRENNKIDL